MELHLLSSQYHRDNVRLSCSQIQRPGGLVLRATVRLPPDRKLPETKGCPERTRKLSVEKPYHVNPSPHFHFRR